MLCLDFGSFPNIFMSGSLFCQCCKRMGRTSPCIRPAKNARVERSEAGFPPNSRNGFLGELMSVSGKGTSFPSVNPSFLMSELHIARMQVFICFFVMEGLTQS
ncbi:hypothetical protein HanPSC8_Chr02g0073761 [Helianthus annuus]|nr:hypothetical protein HanPSC8_Chr02g0073761 [Helianthus annuus]